MNELCVITPFDYLEHVEGYINDINAICSITVVVVVMGHCPLLWPQYSLPETNLYVANRFYCALFYRF